MILEHESEGKRGSFKILIDTFLPSLLVKELQEVICLKIREKTG